MKRGERLHDLFYDAALCAAAHPFGQKVFAAAVPFLRRVFPQEKSTRSSEEVFAELGYAPEVFHTITDSPVRVYEHDLKGLLSFSAHHSISMLSDFFSDEMPASAIMSSSRSANADQETNYILLSDIKTDRAAYLHDMSDMSGLPGRIIERLEGCPRLAKAMTLGHEISHFDMDPTEASKPAQYVEIESFCDAMPFIAFQKVSDPAVFDRTVREIILARAVSPIVEAVEITKKGIELPYPDSIYGHATALLLDDRTLLSQENPGAAVVDAYKTANLRLMAVLDTDARMPSAFVCYCAAKDVLDDQDIPHDPARRAIELYVEAIEYFSPNFAAKALKQHISRSPKTAPHVVQSAGNGDVSLEI